MEMQELAPGLRRWTAPHPDWEPAAAPESPADWDRDVGCVLYDAADAVVLIDPLLPPDRDGFWCWLDEHVGGRDERVVVLTTIAWHDRSTDEVVARYGATTARAPRSLPQGVETFEVPRAGEVMYWLQEPRALVPGDRILGAPGGGLRLCPASWLSYLPSGITVDELRQALRPLLDLPIEMVLVSHGKPVLGGGRAALERALAA